MSQMQLQNDVFEVKTSIAQFQARQIRIMENPVATGGTGQLPTGVSHGFVTLVDATEREHNTLLDQCQCLDVRTLKATFKYLHETQHIDISNWISCFVCVSIGAGPTKQRSESGTLKRTNMIS